MKRISTLILSGGIFLLLNLSVFAEKHETGTSKPAGKTNEFEKDTIHVIGHAHMDMNWLWTYSETMKMCNDNLRQTVAFMDEYPDFTMIQSQASVYKFVEMVDPALFKRVQEYVKEGRLELGGGMWTEGDTNLSSGEALAHSFLFAQRYFLSWFGKMARVGWLPDNFGHTSQLPQMLKLSGLDYFYFHRCKPYMGSFWWKGPDGSMVLCYGNNTYNGTINKDLKNELARIVPGKHRLLQVTGVGDHGGGPTRANIEMVHQLDKLTDYPAVEFTTAGNFFDKLSHEMEGRPTHEGEMEFIFEGCYTTVSDIKQGNRNCENSLFRNEFFNTLRWLNGDPYPATELHDLWETVNFNEFHDILPGSAINEANKEAVARYAEVLRKSKIMSDRAFWRMADEVDFQKGLGQPVVAYNLFPKNRKTIVEATVYSHEEPFTVKAASWGANYYGLNFRPIDKTKPEATQKGDANFLSPEYKNQEIQSNGRVATALVRDGKGNSYEAQIVYCKPTPPGYTTKVQFIDNDFPAGGYKTYYIDVTQPGISAKAVPVNKNTYDTDYYRVKFDMNTGDIVSLVDKRTNTEYVKEGEALNKLRIFLEDKKGGMKSWTINRIVDEQDVTNVESVKVVENGPVRIGVEAVKTWGNSRFIERTYVYKSYPRITYDMEIRWLETGSDSTDSPMLRAIFPLALKNTKFYSQVPFNVVERPVDGMIHGHKAPLSQTSQSQIYGVTPETSDGQEVPAQKWVDVTDGRNGIALLNDSKYGHSYHNGELRLTLMRAAGAPDIYPNLGKFKISYALYPHSGDWQVGDVWTEGDDFNVPVLAKEPPSLALIKEHATRPETASFFSLDATGVILSGIKQAEDGKEFIVRLAEINGNSGHVKLNVPVEIASVRRLNLIEMPLKNVTTPDINGRSVEFQIRPKEIVTLGITPQR